MGIAALEIPRPILRRAPPTARDYARRDRAIELFDQQRYRESIAETFAYLLPNQPIPDLAHEALCLVQGSARVRARIDGDALQVGASLASVGAQTQAVAALRYVLTRLSATGQVFQPRLSDGVIRLEFRDRLELLHPLKLIEAMLRLPSEAERNDAWLVERFALDASDREAIQPLDADELAQATALWAQHWSDVAALMKESRRRRSLFFLEALGAYALHLVRYTLPLFGGLRARLTEMSDTFTDEDVDPDRRETVLAKCIKAMQRVSADELAACLGHARYAINPLQPGTPAMISALLGGGQRLASIGEFRAAGRSLEAALGLVVVYVMLLSQYAWAPEIERMLREGLDLAARKPWLECADVLFDHASRSAQRFGSNAERVREDAAAVLAPA